MLSFDLQQPEGSVNNVGDLIALLASTEEDWKEVNANAEAFVTSLGSSPAAAAAPSPPPPPPPATPEPEGKQSLLGPAVRLLLSTYGLIPEQITGTGPKGTVLKRYTPL